MKKTVSVLALAVLVFTAFCACGPPEYQPVTIDELIANTSVYDGQKVTVTGEYIDLDKFHCNMIEPVPLLGEEECTNPPYVDKYSPYFVGPWGISSGGSEGNIVAFIFQCDADECEPPDFKEGQEIEVRGVVEATVFIGCDCECVKCRSLFIAPATPKDVTIIP